MNILTYNVKGFVNVSCRAFAIVRQCTSPLAANRSFTTRKSDVITSTREAAENCDTFEGPMQQTYPLSKGEAFSFVENVLGLEHPDTLFKTSPLENLTKIAERIKKMSPFTTMQFWDGSVFQMSNEYCKGQMLLRRGGGCVIINPFTKALLEQLGYKTCDVPGIGSASADYFHISTLVCDLCYPGSVHLLELGTVRPLFHPISLDFEKESPVYEVFGLRNKFFKNNDGNLVWCMEPFPKMLNRLGDHEVIQDSTGKKWQIYLIFLLQKKKMGRFYFNRYWHKLLKFQGFIPPRARGFVYNAYKDGDLVNVFAGKNKIFVQTIREDATEEVRDLTKQELSRFFETTFPGYPTRMVNRAIRDDFSMSQVLRDT